MRLSRAEVARYLGRDGAALPPELEALLRTCEQEIARLPYRHAAESFAREELPLAGTEIDRHLASCARVYVLGYTLGAEGDRMLRRWSAQSMAKAAVGQAALTVRLDEIETLCLDRLASELAPGAFLTRPYSPGYGDYPLAEQETLLRLLQGERRLGLFLSRGGMLLPEKSVLSVVGVTPVPPDPQGCGRSCLGCQKRDCRFRRREGAE